MQGHIPRHPERGHLRVIGADPPILLRLAYESPLRLGYGPGTTGILFIRTNDVDSTLINLDLDLYHGGHDLYNRATTGNKMLDKLYDRDLAGRTEYELTSFVWGYFLTMQTMHCMMLRKLLWVHGKLI